MDESGAYVGASAAALRLLGVSSLDELRESASATFDRDAAAPVAGGQEWHGGSLRRSAGEATIVRGDGTTVRVRFAISPHGTRRYRVALAPTDSPPDEPIVVHTMGNILSAWRFAERRLVEVPEGSAEWEQLRAEVERWRSEYRRLFSQQSKSRRSAARGRRRAD